MPTAKGWSRPFDEPIPLPDGGELRTLLDAGRYVDALPPSMHEREEWQMVMEVLRQQIPNRWGFEIGIGCVNNLAQMFTGIAHNKVDAPR
jgi:hypothetical protein